MPPLKQSLHAGGFKVSKLSATLKETVLLTQIYNSCFGFKNINYTHRKLSQLSFLSSSSLPPGGEFQAFLTSAGHTFMSHESC